MPLNNSQWQEAEVQLANNGISASDTFGTAANITAATTFSGVPTISQLAANSFVLLANPGAQATFIAEINVASAFVGTLSFYGLAPDGATLQLIGSHLRGVGTTANATAISTASALNQVWMGSASNFKTIYVVCTAFTSGSVSVQLGLTAAPYALIILNAQALGVNTKANSTSVSIASDQSSPASPLTVEQSILSAERQSLAYVATTGDVAATAGPYMAVSYWNPLGSGKTAVFHRMSGYYTTTANHPFYTIYKETSDPSIGWTTPVPITPVNLDLGSGNTSVLTLNRTSAGNVASQTGTLLFDQDTGANAVGELLGPGSMTVVKVPPNSGLTIYMAALNTTHWNLNSFWFEA